MIRPTVVDGRSFVFVSDSVSTEALWGCSSVWESASLARRRSQVRSLSAPHHLSFQTQAYMHETLGVGVLYGISRKRVDVEDY